MERQFFFGIIFITLNVILTSIKYASAERRPPMYEVYLQGFGNCPGRDSVIDATSLAVKKVNQTALSVDGSVNVASDIPNDTTISLKAFMQVNGKYQRNPVTTAEANICQFIQSDNLYWSIMQSQTSLPKKCPFTKGTYQASGAVVNVVKMPTMLPLGCWKMELSFLNPQNSEIACIYGVAKVTPRNKKATSTCSLE